MSRALSSSKIMSSSNSSSLLIDGLYPASQLDDGVCSVVTPKNTMYDILVFYKKQTPFEIFTVNIKQQKQIVIELKPCFNRKSRSIINYDWKLHGFRP